MGEMEGVMGFGVASWRQCYKSLPGALKTGMVLLLLPQLL